VFTIERRHPGMEEGRRHLSVGELPLKRAPKSYALLPAPPAQPQASQPAPPAPPKPAADPVTLGQAAHDHVHQEPATALRNPRTAPLLS